MGRAIVNSRFYRRRKHAQIWIGIGLVFIAANGFCQQNPARRALLKGKLLMKSGVSKWDRSLMQQARVLFETAINDSADAHLAHYYLGYAYFRLAGYALDNRRKNEANDVLETAIAHLRKAVEADKNFAEALALLSFCTGQKAGLQRWQAADLLRTIKPLMERAVTIAPENPRVTLLRGLAAHHTPNSLGGDKARAMELLRQAAAQFKARQSANELLPEWGHAETYAWLCRLSLAADDREQAERACRQALALDPGYVWVKQNLLPQITGAKKR